MCKKKAVAVLLASVFSLALPLSSIAEQTGQTSTPGPKVTHAAAKSKQAIASRKAPKRTPQHRGKSAAHHRSTAKSKS